MCLITDQQEVLIAQEDITVYKCLREINDNLWAPYNDFRYDLNKLYETIIRESDEWCGFDSFDNRMIQNKYPDFEPAEEHKKLKSFGSGFHSALSKGRLLESWMTNDEYIFECTIPKGSKYYIGISDLVVSNQIIINKKTK